MTFYMWYSKVIKQNWYVNEKKRKEMNLRAYTLQWCRGL